jgi:hypothetical protein
MLAVLALVVVPNANASITSKKPVFGAPVHVNDAFPAAEPSLKVGPDGTIWISAPNFPGAVVGDPVNQGPTGDLVWSSKDQGATFQLHTTPEPILSGLDADILVGNDGTVYVSGLYLGCISTAASIDTAGTAFNDNPLVCGQVNDDREWLATVGNTDLYQAFGSNGDIYLEHAKILPAGTLVPDPQATKLSTVAAGPDAYQWPGYVVADQTTGDVYVAWNTQGPASGAPDSIVIARRHPDGTVTRAVIPAPGDTFDSFVGLSLDSAGNIYAAWNERHGGTRTDTMLSWSKNQGATWAKPVVVNSATTPTTVFPWVRAGDPGRVDVVWYGSTTPGASPQDLPASSTWNVYMAQSLNLFKPRRTFTTVKVTPSPMHVGGICTSGTACGTSDRDLLDYFMVDVDRRGMASIAYAEDDNTSTAQIRYAGQTGGPGLFVPTT